MEIEKILEDKELFWKYILGTSCRYCRACTLKKIKGGQDIWEAQEEVENKPKSVRDQRLALLKAKMKKIDENPDIDLVEETEHYKCDENNCSLVSYMDEGKVNTKYNSIIDGLKRNIDVWKNRGYNISGYYDNNQYGISFIKNEQEIKYSNNSERLSKNIIINATDICALSEWILLVNDDANNFLGEKYGRFRKD